ncbi:aspartyl-phosphate phosphatase Spo0E family protein [Bhargavaea beijingensis]|uniref:Aspartyl-phosphate phosphatase Spo0E family protein n=1 Tax=Bhargavaea beijingensis TaxID=426756 RepID=A0A1G7BLZ3_9BACL|nr:aspartyl-phosphate phosphatase Spo0E family protein [Bhargavaea beijingensis]MCW1926769.1 aspartyl-phosphate phosphatase Spo0E family protein [Bhargavaea beijingensis]RSK36979.1 aspartyl-phosphate phosphatase Spo0E family protein [Bhargavaea beijingensis]SDE28128.1 Spo0E like sporulation regulatory protein [Bhargavaea beijingensis]
MKQSRDEQIEKLRERMTVSAMEKGRRHPETIGLSRQLDELLNCYSSCHNRQREAE